ncbi:PR domain zinc finger protein 15-like isoform X2 [Paramacrobiotus metropolitanus]|uniref:PR domain zinc finger protein 15-like isoform X2 n=1 Tax=Paramacrobiotus metropolitanus TaxID=2943436 RepID=UPI002445D381|nr:PR domain zinc finger protein 15-like isoform X2 [Paramacrobiotus metropolitanus]
MSSGGHCCCVALCSNRKIPGRSQHLQLHRFPFGDPQRLAKWIEFIQRPDLPITESSRICSEHFWKDDYIAATTRGSAPKRPKLKDSAIPARYPSSTLATRRQKRERRSKNDCSSAANDLYRVKHPCEEELPISPEPSRKLRRTAARNERNVAALRSSTLHQTSDVLDGYRKSTFLEECRFSRLYCRQCEVYADEPCRMHSQIIPDSPVVPFAIASLPNVLEFIFSSASESPKGVRARVPIPSQTIFGPLRGAICSRTENKTLIPDVCDRENELIYAVPDPSAECCFKRVHMGSPHTCNWLKFTRFASTIKEQNLAVYLSGNDISFVTTKEIAPGEELKVWYSQKYAELIGFGGTLERVPSPVDEHADTDPPALPDDNHWESSLPPSFPSNSPPSFPPSLPSNLLPNLPPLLPPSLPQDNAPKTVFISFPADVKTFRFIVPIVKKYLPPTPLNSAIVNGISQFVVPQFIEQPDAEDASENADKQQDHEQPSVKSDDGLADPVSSPSSSLAPVEGQCDAPADPGKKSVTATAVAEYIIPVRVPQIRHPKPPSENLHPCTECNVAFTSADLLELHNLGHDQTKIKSLDSQDHPDGIPCPECHAPFTSYFALIAHVVEHRKLYQPRLQCDECGKWFPKPHMAGHMQDAHSDGIEKRHICDKCGIKFPTLRTLALHKQANHLRITCIFCAQLFHTWRPLGDHVKSHVQPDGYHCPNCNVVHAEYKDLARHHRENHDIAQLRCCPVCSKMFSSTNRLKSHMRNHAEGMTHQCGLCGKNFRTQHGLQDHRRWKHGTRTKARAKELKERGTATKYVEPRKRMRFEDFPHRCEECRLGFMREGKLIRHREQRHSGDVD